MKEPEFGKPFMTIKFDDDDDALEILKEAIGGGSIDNAYDETETTEDANQLLFNRLAEAKEKLRLRDAEKLANAKQLDLFT